MFAITVIQAEHRNLGMTLLCFRKLLSDMSNHDRKVDHRLLAATVEYVASFLYRFHHPKEDDYLFPAIMRRCPESEKLIEKLQSDHEKGADACRSLGGSLSEYAADSSAFPEFRDQANTFVTNERNHIGTEESELLPLAKRHLTPSDWEPINDAFRNNDDPIFGIKPTKEYQDLSRVIHNVCIFDNPML